MEGVWTSVSGIMLKANVKSTKSRQIYDSTLVGRTEVVVAAVERFLRSADVFIVPPHIYGEKDRILRACLYKKKER